MKLVTPYVAHTLRPRPLGPQGSGELADGLFRPQLLKALAVPSFLRMTLLKKALTAHHGTIAVVQIRTEAQNDISF